MSTENLLNLKIHKVSSKKYTDDKAADKLDNTALYLTPMPEVKTDDIIHYTENLSDGTVTFSIQDSTTEEKGVVRLSSDASATEESVAATPKGVSAAFTTNYITAGRVDGSMLGECATAEGRSTCASGDCAHAEGIGTIASSEAQHVQGKYNKYTDTDDLVHIVGWGESGAKRKNIHTIDTAGNAYFEGKVKANSFEGNGANLTSLSVGNINTETVTRDAEFMKCLINMVHPVGSVIMTVNKDFRPEYAYPGTKWTSWRDGYLKVVDGNDQDLPSSDATDVKGATNYKITADMLPKHTHDILHDHEYKPKVQSTTDLTGSFTILGTDIEKVDEGDGKARVILTTTGKFSRAHIIDGSVNDYGNSITISSDDSEPTSGYYPDKISLDVNHTHIGIAGKTLSQTKEMSGDGAFANSAYMPGYYAVIAWQRTS